MLDHNQMEIFSIVEKSLNIHSGSYEYVIKIPLNPLLAILYTIYFIACVNVHCVIIIIIQYNHCSMC